MREKPEPDLSVGGIGHYMAAAWRMGYELFSEGAKVTGAIVKGGVVVISFAVEGVIHTVSFLTDHAAMFVGGMGGQKPPED